MTTWRITLQDFNGKRKTFRGFATQADAENFAQQQVNGQTEWETAFFPAAKEREPNHRALN